MLLKNKLTAYVVGSLLLGVVITVAIAIGLILSSFPDWIESTERMNLERLSLERAQFAALYFTRVANEVHGLCDYTQGVWEGTINGSTLTSYPVFDINFSQVVPGYSETELGFEASFDVTGWWQCGPGEIEQSCNGIAEEDQTALTVERKRLTTLLIVAYRNMFRARLPLGPLGVWGVAFEDDGFFNSYPLVDSNPSMDMVSFCHATKLPNKVGYDPRCRVWYEDAKKQDSLIFTTPYFFAAIGGFESELGVTAAMPFRASSGPGIESENQFTGVCMTDFTAEDVRLSITSRLLQDGYGYMVDSDGLTVFHPNLDWATVDTAPHISTLEFAERQSPGALAFESTVLEKMQQGGAGSARYEKDDDVWIVSWAPVQGRNFIAALTVPEKDIKRPFDRARTSIEEVIGLMVGVSMTFVMIVAIGSTWRARRLAGQLVQPILQLRDLVRKVNDRDFSGEVPDTSAASKELEALHQVFSQLYSVIRFANASFFQGDVGGAKQMFLRALEVFQQLGNNRGAGLCYNNLGGVHLQSNEFDDAVAAFTEAVRYAREATEGFYAESGLGGDRGMSGIAPGPRMNRVPEEEPSESSWREREELAWQELRRRINLSRALEARATSRQFGDEEADGGGAVVTPSSWKTRMDKRRRRSSWEDPRMDYNAAAEELLYTQRILSWLREHHDHKPPSGSTGARTNALDAHPQAPEALSLDRERLETKLAAEEGSLRARGGLVDDGRQLVEWAKEQWQAVQTDMSQLSVPLCAALLGQAPPGSEKVATLDGAEAEPLETTQLRITLAEARVLHQSGDSNAAVGLLSSGLRSTPLGPTSLFLSCLAEMRRWLRAAGETDAASRCQWSIQKPRDVVILIDYSGSMAGPGERMQKTRFHAEHLVQERLSGLDRVALFTFNSTVHRHCDLLQTSTDAERLCVELRSLNSPSMQTAMYDALLQGLDVFAEMDASSLASGDRSRFLVALTDGDDNRSRATANDVVTRLRENQLDVSVIIIGVGQLRNQAEFDRICEASKNGAFVAAADSDGGTSDLDAAFERVSELMVSAEVILESY